MGAKLAGVMVIILIAAGGVGYWYYNDTQQRLAILNENNAKLNVAINLNEETITSLEADYKKVNEELTTINQQFADVRKQNNRLNEKLATIDLGLAAVNNPDGIGRAVNAGTENAGRCFELLSGADLNEKEKGAKNGIQFNKECPWLWPGVDTP